MQVYIALVNFKHLTVVMFGKIQHKIKAQVNCDALIQNQDTNSGFQC